MTIIGCFTDHPPITKTLKAVNYGDLWTKI